MFISNGRAPSLLGFGLEGRLNFPREINLAQARFLD
jgi:hypothetical protein